MAYLELTPAECLRILGYREQDVPEALIVEGNYLTLQRIEAAMGHMMRVRKSRLGYLVVGERSGARIGYACVYGAPEAIEVTWLLGRAGLRSVLVAGQCGGLRPGLTLGDFIVPTRVHSGEGTARYLLKGREDVEATPVMRGRVEQFLRARSHRVHTGPFLTWLDILLESRADIARWHDAGFVGVDMEVGAVFAVAEALGMERGAMLLMVDNVYEGKKVTDPWTDVDRELYRARMQGLIPMAMDVFAERPSAQR